MQKSWKASQRKILSMTFHARHGQDENFSGMMTPSDDEGHGIFMTWSM